MKMRCDEDEVWQRLGMVKIRFIEDRVVLMKTVTGDDNVW